MAWAIIWLALDAGDCRMLQSRAEMRWRSPGDDWRYSDSRGVSFGYSERGEEASDLAGDLGLEAPGYRGDFGAENLGIFMFILGVILRWKCRVFLGENIQIFL